VATHLDASHRVFPPLNLKPCHPQAPPWQDHPSVPHSGRVQRELEAWGDTTFSPNLTARCVVGKEHHFIHRSDALSMMGRCVCSMLPGSLTVAAVPYPYARSVKDMAPPPKNLVGSALSCILCPTRHQNSCRLRVLLFLPLIPSCGGIGHAVSLAEPGYGGSAVTWLGWKPHPCCHFSSRLHFSRVLSERIGA
jgi:hypothetical protein